MTQNYLNMHKISLFMKIRLPFKLVTTVREIISMVINHQIIRHLD